MEQEESGSLPLNGMQCFRLAHDVLFREVLFAMNYLCTEAVILAILN